MEERESGLIPGRTSVGRLGRWDRPHLPRDGTTVPGPGTVAVKVEGGQSPHRRDRTTPRKRDRS